MQSEGQNQATRPLQVVVTLVALVMSLALMVMGVQLYTSLDDKNREALQHASTAFSHVQQQTYSYSRMMASNAVVQRGAWFNNTGMVLDYGTSVLKELKVDEITVQNRDGIILAQAHSPKKFNIADADNPAFKYAAAGKTVSRVARGDLGFVIQTTSPIYHETEKNRFVGAVTVGYLLNNEMAGLLRDLSGVDVLIVKGNTIVSASLAEVANTKLEALPSTQKVAGVSRDVWSTPIQTEGLRDLYLAVALDNTKIKLVFFWIMLFIPVLIVLLVQRSGGAPMDAHSLSRRR